MTPESHTILNAIIDRAASVSQAIGELVTGLLGLMAWRSARHAARLGELNSGKMEAVKLSVDGILAAKIAAAKQEGKEHEQDMQHQREQQTATLVGVIGDPASSQADKTVAAIDASKPV